MADVFIGSEAVAAGLLTRGKLRWNYRAIFPDVYIAKEASASLFDRITGAWLWSGRRAVIAGLSAAVLHGSHLVDESAPVELIWRCGRPPPGIVVRNERIEPDEVAEVSGLAVTTPGRTALDVARHADRNTAVTHLDALACAKDLTAADVRPLTDRYRGAPGVRRSVTALDLMDGGSKTPMATMVRLHLVDAGFPVPRTQISVDDGTTAAVVEMGYEAPMVGVEFGGDASKSLTRLGWTIICGEGKNPLTIVYLMRAAVIERGFPLYRLQRMSRY
ncbi:hypothetical protein [Mycolicibacterium tusciae]|uniref:hypothetical protein n=1 Tax=Mycolicibacterium tusciae TaxID=75922 RepID=UPI00024A16A9|nr:hypothetical protein [Mycolicibacterium tusciae]